MANNNQSRGNRSSNKGNTRGNQGSTSNRGFASMDPEQQREIASKGGQAAHKQGVAHEWNSEEAREAGRKGGQASRGGRNTNSSGNTGNEEMSEGENDNDHDF